MSHRFILLVLVTKLEILSNYGQQQHFPQRRSQSHHCWQWCDFQAVRAWTLCIETLPRWYLGQCVNCITSTAAILLWVKKNLMRDIIKIRNKIIQCYFFNMSEIPRAFQSITFVFTHISYRRSDLWFHIVQTGLWLRTCVQLVFSIHVYLQGKYID